METASAFKLHAPEGFGVNAPSYGDRVPASVVDARLSGGARRATGEVIDATLKKSHRQCLTRIALGNRMLAAHDVTNLVLERLGLIRRVGEVRPHPLRGYPSVEWAITEAGRNALQASSALL